MTAPISDPAIRKLRQVRDLASLTEYLRNELDWPIADWDLEDLTFRYTPEEAGLDAASAVKVHSIQRLRPLSNDAPWGIFFIDFVPGDLPITVLRRILRAVVVQKRQAGRPDRQAWQMDDLLFISALGPDGARDVNLARFNEDPNSKVPTLRVVEWDEADTTFHLLRTSGELDRLEWRRRDETLDQWRERWASAFQLRPREVATTARMLASQMAQLAIRIRRRVNDAMAVEGENGPLRKMFRAFREVLLHDLTEDGFADMYAQTITYGLFAARRSRPTGITLDNAKDMVPSTNPFLRDLLAQFTEAQGLTQSLDFDELGVDALIETLNRANIDAVIEDWGRDKAGEDPVIHFYEDFLREYDKKQKVQRGVFFTPRPVVSFIVRSVHELLQTEFKLEDGLASTDTWADMLARFPDLKIPEGAAPETPFVQVLDPAVGTGTFLVEVIDVIHRTMTAKWLKQGYKPMFDFERLWNEYVPKHLLPRIYGFELMMASYTIAHMKVGLKLFELGYRFGADERLRIYLTNTLEPPQDFSGQFEIMAPALAHEAKAVNEVKAITRFTLLLGNPPYSGRSSNLTPFARGMVEAYKYIGGARVQEKGALQLEKNLNDDYVKFLRFSQLRVERTGTGIVSMITNNSFLENPTLRGMRSSLMHTFGRCAFIDLHGNVARHERAADGTRDENVFEISQGVAISVLVRPPRAAQPTSMHRADLLASQNEKYEWLFGHKAATMGSVTLAPSPPLLLFRAEDVSVRSEYMEFTSVVEIFPINSTGVKTHRDAFCIDQDRLKLEERISELRSPVVSDDELRSKYGLHDTYGWTMRRSRARLRDETNWARWFTRILYRPMDERYIYFSPDVVELPRMEVSRHLLVPGNVAFVFMRQVAGDEPYTHFLVSRHPVDNRAFYSNRGTMSMAPLWLHGNGTGTPAGNIDSLHAREIGARVGRAYSPLPEPGIGSLGPADILHYIYAIAFSESYRSRYDKFLRVDFPRIPYTDSQELFARFAG